MNDYKELIAELKEEWNDCDRLISDKIAINLGMLTEKHYVTLAEDCCGEMVGIMQTIDCAIDAIEQLVKERDAAVKDMNTLCSTFADICSFCKNDSRNDGDVCVKCEGTDWLEFWEWRGVKEDNDGKID